MIPFNGCFSDSSRHISLDVDSLLAAYSRLADLSQIPDRFLEERSAHFFQEKIYRSLGCKAIHNFCTVLNVMDTLDIPYISR